MLIESNNYQPNSKSYDNSDAWFSFHQMLNEKQYSDSYNIYSEKLVSKTYTMYHFKIRDVIRGAKVANSDTMPLPTCGSNLRLSLKYPRGSSVFTSISFL